MKVKAKVSFCGPLCMAIGEVRNVTDEVLLADLLKAGYVVPVEEPAKEKPAAPAAEAEAPKRGSRKKKVVS